MHGSRNGARIALTALALVLGGGCARDGGPARLESPADWAVHASPDEQGPRSAALILFSDPAAARYHMRMHFQDLRTVEQLLIAGRREEGLALAHLLARPSDDAGLAAWQAQSRSVTDAALEVSRAPSVDEALRGVARVAVACAGCHIAARSLPRFAPPPALPRDGQTRATRMARHAWAADRLWEGVVGADDARWRRGLAVLDEAPMPSAVVTVAPGFAKDLQARVHEQLDLRAATAVEDRGVAYGEILVACAGCHASLHAVAR